MPRLTLRTLLAYIDDTLEPVQARSLGHKVAESDEAKHLIERIKRVTRRRGLSTPVPDGTEDDVADPNTVAAYLSDNLDSEQLKQIESTCLESDVHLAEVAACHQILTLVLTEPVRVPPTANQRMYMLVPSPASDHRRKPGRTIPVGGVIPPAPDQADADDPDAALLLGLKRYSTADSWARRLGLVGAVLGLAIVLGFSVWMSLPQHQQRPEIASEGVNYAQAAPPSTTPEPKVVILPKVVVPPPPPTTPVKETAPEPKVVKTVPPPEIEKATEPLPGNGIVGKMETQNVIVLTRPGGGNWVRIDPAEPAVRAGMPVMALPGYKAEVKLDSGVNVHLWGNLPLQVAMREMVTASVVRFHMPPPGFDADITLEAGRIYIGAQKPTGAKVRLRIASELWDVHLPDDKSEVLVQMHSSFVPGTPYPTGGSGGEKPRTQAHLIVVRGAASFAAPARFKKFETMPTQSAISWDSKTNVLAGPAPLKKNERDELLPDRIPLIDAEQGQIVQRALSDSATKLTDRAGIRVLLEERLNYDASKDNIVPTMIAVTQYAAIAEGPETPSLVANLYDLLKSTERSYARQAAVIALSAWLPRAPDNTATFVKVLSDRKQVPPDDADLIAQLLRGYGMASSGDTSKVDDLVKMLDSEWVPVREAAFGNLIAFYDPEAMRNPALVADVSARGTPPYDAFLKAWRLHAEEIKKKMTSEKK
jgi:hypothetical protein